jgi:hypothetical protein
MMRRVSGSLLAELVPALVLVCSSTGLALASEGVIEINHARALAGGVTPGDAPGYPVTVSTAGSYRLTSDLVMPDAGTSGIELTADHVQLDLAGFAIVGPVQCTSGSCSSSGAGMGIQGVFAAGQAADDVVLRNGTLRGAGRFGAALGASCRVERMTFSGNGDAGLVLGLLGWVSESRAENNDSDGFRLNSSSRIENCIAMLNGGYGITVFGSSVRVEGCTVSANLGGGINGADLVVLHGLVSGNTGIGGIRLLTRGMVLGSQVIGNTGSGISCVGSVSSSEGCLVADSVVVGNSGAGLDMDPSGTPGTAGYRATVLTGNTPNVNGVAVQLDPNLCNGAICP